MESVYNISLKTNAGEDFYLLLGNFLDAFYLADSNQRVEMINEAPLDMEMPEYVPFLAASAHKLAIDYELIPPDWVFEKRCYLSGKNPHFAFNAKGDMRLWLMYKSPSEFKHRNLFVDENVLVRV